ncbi:MAG TPA: hypothetical protein VGO62_07290, partial [Myxococcota bacterium]
EPAHVAHGVERASQIHRVLEAELPRIERVGFRVARASSVAEPFARALLDAILELKEELLRHTAVAEATVHPRAGTADATILVDEQALDEPRIRSLVMRARSVAASTTSPSARVLHHRLGELDRDVEALFVVERSLGAN